MKLIKLLHPFLLYNIISQINFFSTDSQCFHIQLALMIYTNTESYVLFLSFESYSELPPWHPDLFQINYAKLPLSKALCTTQQMKTAAQEAIQNTAATNIYYTDGSLDTNVPAAAAAVVSDSLRGSWRLSSNSSTLQTELTAIEKALEH